jgi:hypothetical protein
VITVRDPSDGPPAGTIESFLNHSLARLLISMPTMFVAATMTLTLLIASAETYGLFLTLASVSALYLVLKHALRV